MVESIAPLVALGAALCAVAALAEASAPAPNLIPADGPAPRRLPSWLSAGVRASTRARIEALVRDAGVASTPESLVAARRVSVGVVIALAIVVGGPFVPLAVPLVAVSTRAPEMVLRRLARRRAREAERELPVFLDLLAVATSAGLAPQLAVRRAAEPLVGPLADELARVMRDVDLGGRWRDELAVAADASGQPDLRRAVRLLIRTERLGSSLAEEMARLAVDVREARRSRATERARAAPVKMLFPLVFLILPAFLLLTVVPVLLTTVRSIG